MLVRWLLLWQVDEVFSTAGVTTVCSAFATNLEVPLGGLKVHATQVWVVRGVEVGIEEVGGVLRGGRGTRRGWGQS